MGTVDRNITALVVDDHEICRSLLRVRLQRLCVQVLEACNGQEAVDLCRSERPHLVFMDIDMPIMDGIEAVRQLRREKLDLKVIGFSAGLTPERKSAGLSVGMDHVVGKHIDLADLIAWIEEVGSFNVVHRGRYSTSATPLPNQTGCVRPAFPHGTSTS